MSASSMYDTSSDMELDEFVDRGAEEEDDDSFSEEIEEEVEEITTTTTTKKTTKTASSLSQWSQKQRVRKTLRNLEKL